MSEARRVFPNVRCPNCQGFWVGGAVHAPHWRNGVLVDCVGREVKP